MTTGQYSNDNTDLLLTVYKVYAISKGYYKVNAVLTNKHNGIFYQNIKKVLTSHFLTRIGPVGGSRSSAHQE